MHDVISTISRTDRPLLALSLAFFAIAGVANTSLAATLQSAVAVTVAVAGVYGLALYARTASRSHLARLSIGLWIAFLAVTPGHFVGVGAFGPLSAEITVALVHAVTWATLLGACASTAFLGFREYGAQTSADTPEEQVLDQDLDL